MTTTTSARTLYDCPSLCQRIDHDADVVDIGHPPLHFGPEFGPIYIQGRDGDLEAVISDDLDDGSLTPPVLRRLAREAVAAAEWLEAHQ